MAYPWNPPAARSVPWLTGMPALLALLLPLLLASPTIESVEIRGLKTLSEETLLHYLGLEPGQPLDEEALNRNIKELWARNLVDDVEVESFPTPAGVRLQITISERPIVRSIDYAGLKRITRTDLQDRMTSRRIRAREGEPLSLGELQRIKTLIEEMYGEKGYRFAAAQFAVVCRLCVTAGRSGSAAARSRSTAPAPSPRRSSPGAFPST